MPGCPPPPVPWVEGRPGAAPSSAVLGLLRGCCHWRKEPRRAGGPARPGGGGGGGEGEGERERKGEGELQLNSLGGGGGGGENLGTRLVRGRGNEASIRHEELINKYRTKLLNLNVI